MPKRVEPKRTSYLFKGKIDEKEYIFTLNLQRF